MLTWAETRRRYEAAVVRCWPSRLEQRTWRIVADDFERLTPVRSLADAVGCLGAFEAALVAEEVDTESLAIYPAMVVDAVEWARGDSGERLA